MNKLITEKLLDNYKKKYIRTAELNYFEKQRKSQCSLRRTKVITQNSCNESLLRKLQRKFDNAMSYLKYHILKSLFLYRQKKKYLKLSISFLFQTGTRFITTVLTMKTFKRAPQNQYLIAVMLSTHDLSSNSSCHFSFVLYQWSVM